MRENLNDRESRRRRYIRHLAGVIKRKNRMKSVTIKEFLELVRKMSPVMRKRETVSPRIRVTMTTTMRVRVNS